MLTGTPTLEEMPLFPEQVNSTVGVGDDGSVERVAPELRELFFQSVTWTTKNVILVKEPCLPAIFLQQRLCQSIPVKNAGQGAEVVPNHHDDELVHR